MQNGAYDESGSQQSDAATHGADRGAATEVARITQGDRLGAVRGRTDNRILDYLRRMSINVLVALGTRKRCPQNSGGGYDEVGKRPLASVEHPSVRVVLPDGTYFPRRGSGGSVQPETKEEPTGRRCEKGQEPPREVIMPLTTLEPDTHLKIRYTVPRKRMIEYHVVANHPVDTYILDEEGLAEFYAGEEYIQSYGGFTRRLKHKQELGLPFGGWWYLIIKNPDQDQSVSVYYEVSG